jgi:hypothetical protein
MAFTVAEQPSNSPWLRTRAVPFYAFNPFWQCGLYRSISMWNYSARGRTVKLAQQLLLE